ncbi:MAG: type III-B CRISPR module-associated protein Cmr3 [Acidobacteriota bacterium]|nr:type III-B CRISPR module-associated protein Cmr3 [Acidobacteriota bacterium]
MKETWLIEPRDSLIVRDGKPFGLGAGNRADSIQFPFPSTLIGAIRTRVGLEKIGGDRGKFNGALSDEVQREISIKGPFLVEVRDTEVDLLVFSPSDCVVFEVEDNSVNGELIPLLPLEKDKSYVTDLQEELHLCGLVRFEKAKPHRRAPRFWFWQKFEDWLKEAKVTTENLNSLGIFGLEKDRRIHVAIDYKKRAAREGMLFETRGLEFISVSSSNQAKFKRYAIALQVDYGNFSERLVETIAPLGGERRLAYWQKVNLDLPCIPPEIKQKIVSEKHCRLILLTPAVFEDGFLPKWLLENVTELKIEIKAVALNRYQVISGWDFKKGKPKPTRRLCPAGTTFFLKLEGGEDSIEKWIDKVWFSNVSDDEQDRKDGFGLAALGVWDGRFLKLEEVLK